ncbi:hypothetical protein JCM11641_001389 [Rhodosporidiobolus odoratus]
MASAPRKSATTKGNRRASLPSSLSTPSTASPLASTSQNTLDSPASTTNKRNKANKRGRKSLPARLEPQVVDQVETEKLDEGNKDDRFASFLADAEADGLDASVQDGEDLAGQESGEQDDEPAFDDDEPLQDAVGENDPSQPDSRFTFPAADDNGADEAELTEKELLARTSLPAHLLPRSATAGKNGKTPGLIYLSRIPPGMGPGKVKHLLSQFGEVGRIYLARADKGKEVSIAKQRKQKERHQSHNFKEGWVEYLDKRVARSVAEMLNAQTIGGKKSDRWHDDVWTMKYLPRFRWDQLSEQVALERATTTSLLRFHLTHSKSEQESYLSAVERARTHSKIEEKAAARGKVPKKRSAEGEGEREGQGHGEAKKRFRQREVVDTSKKLKRGEDAGKTLENVLGRLF